MRGSRRGVGVALFLLTVTVFWPLRHAGFVNFDDGYYVYENPWVRGGLTPDGVRWALLRFHGANWHPLTWLSHMTDVEMFGVAPGGPHLVSVVLHAINTTLLFALLVRATGALWPSTLVAALFAFHPLHVESVAWISERKDVLSTTFWMLALNAYLSWVRRGGAGRYLGVLLLLVFGLASKAMVVTLPCVLLLLDVWPLGRTAWAEAALPGSGRRAAWSSLVLEKVPMFVLVAAASALTVSAQRAGGAVVSSRALSVSDRLAHTPTAYVWYVVKMVWPAGLAVLYPHPALRENGGGPPAAWLGPLAVLAMVTLFAWSQRRRRPFLGIGWLWFLGTLVPVIGLVQVGGQATADRYSYVPLVGLFLAVAWAAAECARRGPVARGVVSALAACWLVACVGVTRSQLGHWSDARSIAQRALEVTSENYVMHFNLGLALHEEGDLQGARRHYEKAIAIEPRQASFHGNLGTVLTALGRPREAMERYEAAIALAPEQPGPRNNLAWLLATSSDPSVRDGRAALRFAEQALRLGDPQDARLLDTLAAAQAEVGNFAAARRTSARALRRAEAAGDADLSQGIRRRIEQYARGRRHREGGRLGRGLTARIFAEARTFWLPLGIRGAICDRERI